MKAILKSYKEAKEKETLLAYGRALEEKGWVCNYLEGGYLSPDHSTLFIFGRCPYEGQLLQFKPDKTEEYHALVKEFLESGDFISCVSDY